VAADIFSFIQPMMALPVRDLPTGNWIYEMKFDDRALAIKADKEVRSVFVQSSNLAVNGEAFSLQRFEGTDQNWIIVVEALPVA
jgi:hypothetical protein